MPTVTVKIENKNHVNLPYDTMEYVPVESCPLCKRSISPTCIYSLAYHHDNADYVALLDYCSGCRAPFISTYLLDPVKQSTRYHYYPSVFVSAEPSRFSPDHFDEGIETLSPGFVEIYNQALAAESASLNEIAGIGYRKALEYLVKDYAVSRNPSDAESIKPMPLSPCIKKYVVNDQIRILSERAAWIGNDEAHYVRKQEDRDMADMKRFIRALVYFIGMDLIANDARSMEPQ